MVPDDVSLVQNHPPPVNLEESGSGGGALLFLLQFNRGTLVSLNHTQVCAHVCVAQEKKSHSTGILQRIMPL